MLKKTSRSLLSMLLACLFSTTSFAEGDAPHWGYLGETGPENWGNLDPSYAPCKVGKNQTPIDIKKGVEGQLPAIMFKYHAGGYEVFNNGHTIQVNYKPGSTITLDGDVFELKQFHFHAPSENLINGKPYPMEGHFVHADQAGNLAVIGVMYEEGEASKTLKKAWDAMPKDAGQKVALSGALHADDLLPEKRDYYRFSGSLTTPPCTEGVRWVVMKDTVKLSKDQITDFEHVMHHPNNRPVQPVNARVVVQ